MKILVNGPLCYGIADTEAQATRNARRQCPRFSGQNRFKVLAVYEVSDDVRVDDMGRIYAKHIRTIREVQS